MQTCPRMLMPPISRYMTPAPHAVAPNDTVLAARAVMGQYRIHHLPVVAEQALVGIVSDRDLHGASDDSVADAMSRQVASVATLAPLDEVVALMEAQRIGSVVVVGAAGVEGIFTLTDALRAFGDMLRRMERGER